MLKASNLVKSYAGQLLFEDVSFNLNRGERLGLVGRNGSGKTTLLRMVLGLETPDSGSIAVPKHYRIGYLEQHINFTEETVLLEACRGLPQSQEHESWRAEKILLGLGFAVSDLARPPAEFSGGFQVRLNLAKVLISDPDLLLLDEPTNYLDIVSIRWLTRFLNAWKRELILITHDREFMDRVTTHTMAIHRQGVRKIAGDTQKLYDQLAQEEEIYEKTRLNDEKKRKEVEQFINRFRAKARLANLVQSRIKTLQKQQRREKLEKIKSIDFSFNSAPFPAKILVEAENLAFQYGDAAPLFENLNLSIANGDRICIVGKNGKGKTTLLKVLAGELAPKKGAIRSHAACQTGFFVQTNESRLAPNHTVEDEIMVSDPDCTRQQARDIAGAMLFSGDQALKPISVLSGGEKSRVLLGKILATPCNLLLLDEPTNHLDMESCDSLLAALDEFPGAVILVTHDEMFLQTLAEGLIVFDRGKVTLLESSYEDFLERVGWESDEAIDETKPSEPSREQAPDNSKPLDKKMLRKERAQIVQQRSRELTPLENEISLLEMRIEELETELAENNQRMIEASRNGDARAIADYARTDREIKSQLEDHYDRLDRLTTELETRSREFEQKLQMVSIP